MYLNYYALLQSTGYNIGTDGDNWSSVLGMVGQFFFYVIVFVFVAILAYYTTKWIASSRYTKRGSSNLQVIESMTVGYQSNVQLIKVGEKYVLIGVTKERITLLTEFSKDEIVVDDMEHSGHGIDKISFEKYLNQFFQKKKDQ